MSVSIRTQAERALLHDGVTARVMRDGWAPFMPEDRAVLAEMQREGIVYVSERSGRYRLTSAGVLAAAQLRGAR